MTRFAEKVLEALPTTVFYLSSLGFLLILILLGFNFPSNVFHVLKIFHFGILFSILSSYTLRFFLTFRTKLTKPERTWNALFAFISILLILFFVLMLRVNNERDLLLNLSSYSLISLVFFVEISKRTFNYDWLSINPRILFILTFFGIILLGTLLLMLPKSTVNGISFIDALFTSTSAVCVTGLAVVDTQYVFTQFGQIIIMMLIQVGGLGVMTFTSFLGIFFIKRTSFRNQIVMQDFVGSERYNEVFKTVIKIVLSTLLIEFIGALLLFVSVDNTMDMRLSERFFFSVFHSVSAFCNAGFSTLSMGLAHEQLKFNYAIQLIIASLLVLGGLGFSVFINLYKYLKHYLTNKIRQFFLKDNFHHLPWVININTIIVVLTTTVLIVLGTAIVYIFEYNYILSEHTGFGKLVTAFFASVTPRTAGFNAFNFGELQTSTLLIIILLMWIGASPGSTGGGIKTSTFFIAVLNVFNLSKGKDRIEFMRRKISNISVRRAYALLFLSLVVIGIGTLLMTFFEKDKPLLAIVFEVVSAYSTVGLSMGITFTLSLASKMLIIAIMFLGRVGMLSVLIGLFTQVRTLNYQYPKEEIIVM